MAASSSRGVTFPYLITGVIVIAVSFYVDVRYTQYPEVSRVFGMLLVSLGLASVFWSTLVARDAVLGEIEPRSDKLIQRGPFALVRHPMYLGFSIALSGIAISARSWPGLICVFLLFVPSAIFRAKMEERALAAKFGEEWQAYAARVPFMLPGPRRK
jgi:protein-S-isoprenylcysteine O-methyltransferase Ste14